jgi:CTP:molybdopterin cytidylyltransferase MocA
MSDVAMWAVVLAGGRSSRLSGRAKAALAGPGGTLLERAVRNCAAVGALGIAVVGPAGELRPHLVVEPHLAARIRWTCENPPFGGPARGIAAGVAALLEWPPVAPDAGATGSALAWGASREARAEAGPVGAAGSTGADGAGVGGSDGGGPPRRGSREAAAEAGTAGSTGENAAGAGGSDGGGLPWGDSREAPAGAGPAGLCGAHDGGGSPTAGGAGGAGAEDLVIVLACDMPGAGDGIGQVVAAARQRCGGGVLAQDPGGRDQWLLGVWRVGRLAAACAKLPPGGSGEAARVLLAPLAPRRITVPEAAAGDIDTWDDARRLGYR